MGTCKPGNGISYISSRTFINEKVGDSPSPDKFVQRDDIKGQDDLGLHNSNPEVLIRNIESHSVCLIRSYALSCGYGHRCSHKRISHTLILYLARSPKFMAVSCKVRRSFLGVREWHERLGLEAITQLGTAQVAPAAHHRLGRKCSSEAGGRFSRPVSIPSSLASSRYFALASANIAALEEASTF